MFNLSLDGFANKDGALRRLDPRTKLAWALSATLAILMSSDVFFSAAIAALCIGQFLCLGLPKKIVLSKAAASLGMALMLAICQTFMTGSTPLFSFSFAGMMLTATREGLQHGILLSSRALGAGSVMLLLSAVTPAYEIFLTLRWLGLPASLVEIAMLIYRYAFVLLERAGDIMTAQKIRLGYSGIGNSLSSMGTLEGALMLGSIDQAAAVFESMRVRGYNGRMPFGAMPRIKSLDRCLACLAPLVALAVSLAMRI